MNAHETVELFLEADADPMAKKLVTLEYRPYPKGEDWIWFWILHPEDMQRAIAHGEGKSRAEASTAARLKAHQLRVTIIRVTVVNPYGSHSTAFVPPA
jgi:phosphoribosylformylglycinamidine (FGAM) synthase-like amidotransferase family enzyme